MAQELLVSAVLQLKAISIFLFFFLRTHECYVPDNIVECRHEGDVILTEKVFVNLK